MRKNDLGTWIWTSGDIRTLKVSYHKQWTCSRCKSRVEKKTRYCPDCGQKKNIDTLKDN